MSGWEDGYEDDEGLPKALSGPSTPSKGPRGSKWKVGKAAFTANQVPKMIGKQKEDKQKRSLPKSPQKRRSYSLLRLSHKEMGKDVGKRTYKGLDSKAIDTALDEEMCEMHRLMDLREKAKEEMRENEKALMKAFHRKLTPQDYKEDKLLHDAEKKYKHYRKRVKELEPIVDELKQVLQDTQVREAQEWEAREALATQQEESYLCCFIKVRTFVETHRTKPVWQMETVLALEKLLQRSQDGVDRMSNQVNTLEKLCGASAPPKPDKRRLKLLHKLEQRSAGIKAVITFMYDEKQAEREGFVVNVMSELDKLVDLETELEKKMDMDGMNDYSQMLRHMSMLDSTLITQMSRQQVDNALRIIEKMQNAGYTEKGIRVVLNALFLPTWREAIPSAWRLFDDDGSGCLEVTEFKIVVDLMIPYNPTNEELEQLWAVIDRDGSGAIEYHEFTDLMLLLRSKNDTKGKSMLNQALFDNSTIIGSTLTKGKAWAVLDANVRSRLNQTELRHAGKVVVNMENAGFSASQIKTICNALIISKSEKHLMEAFKILDVTGSGMIDAPDFRTVLPLLGEDVSDEIVLDMFSRYDIDGSGFIEFDEFAKMIHELNPKRTDDDIFNIQFDSFGLRASQAQAARRGLKQETKDKLSLKDLVKAGKVVINLQEAGYSDDDIDVLIQALFVKEMDSFTAQKCLIGAWDVLGGQRKGFLDTEDFKGIVPLFSTAISELQINKMFDAVDQDGNGMLEFDEFEQVMNELRNLPDDVVKKASVLETGQRALIAQAFIEQVFSDNEELDLTKLTLNDYTKIGLVLQNMRNKGYEDRVTAQVLKALFLQHTRDNMLKAFRFLCDWGSRKLTTEKFERLLPLLGENIPPSLLDDLFARADADGSGSLDFDEFYELILLLNPADTSKDSKERLTLNLNINGVANSAKNSFIKAKPLIPSGK